MPLSRAPRRHLPCWWNSAERTTLPGFAKADLETLSTELQTALADLKALENQFGPVLETIDEKAGALRPKLQGLYAALKGLLTYDEQLDLLETIQE
jgi:ABC-type transporter Mla subunit MlaD